MTARAFITGLSGTILTPQERAFLREADPWGLIVFKRNIESPDQVARLTGAFREAVGREAPVLVDQEGGRVQRLGPPHWPVYPPGAAYANLYDRDAAAGLKAAYLGARLIAADLLAVGIGLPKPDRGTTINSVLDKNVLGEFNKISVDVFQRPGKDA